MKNILFVCLHNPARNQMEEAILTQIAKIQNIDIQAKSAGTAFQIFEKMHLKALSEIDLDTSCLNPIQNTFNVITTGCEISLNHRPSLPFPTAVDWQLLYPSEMDMDQTRKSQRNSQRNGSRTGSTTLGFLTIPHIITFK